MRRFWWIAFWVFDVLILCLFAAGYVARWVDPRTFWLPQLFGIALPLFSILILLAALGFAIAKHWPMVAVHGFFAIFIGLRFFSLDTQSQEIHPDDDVLRVASYNLGHFELYSQAEQAKKLGEVLNLLYPDIIGLQEFLVYYKGRELRIRNLPYVANKLDSLGYQTVASTMHDVPSTFKPVWTRKGKLDQVEKQHVKFNDEALDALSFTRMKFHWQGRDAVYYNVHLQTFGSKPWLDNSMSPLSPKFWAVYLGQYKEAFQYRASQAEKIRQMVADEEIPVIVGGDFNSTPHNWAYAHLAEGLTDVHEVTGTGRTPSFHVDFPLAKIDHLLVTDEWMVYQAQVSPLDYSDHKPLIAVLGWDE